MREFELDNALAVAKRHKIDATNLSDVVNPAGYNHFLSDV
jgi:hypothetical protein